MQQEDEMDGPEDAWHRNGVFEWLNQCAATWTMLSFYYFFYFGWLSAVSAYR